MIQDAIARVIDKKDLAMDEMTVVMEEITTGQATPAQIASLLTALRMKGETVDEITAAARVMRQKATRITVEEASSGDSIPILDTCGTGGDQLKTFNISTAAAFVAAGAGIRVAKHGNRSVSSSCGSADVLEAMGINLQLAPVRIASSIRLHGIGFLFAPVLHGSMKHAIGPRKEMGVRTMFNLLGPLTNPAGTSFQIMGVFSRHLVTPLATVLGKLGCRHAMVVHGEDGMDEITTTGKTYVSEWLNGEALEYTIHPDDFGLARSRLEDLHGSNAEENARIISDIFSGKTGPHRDIVLLNAGAALYVAGAAQTLAQGIQLAEQAVDQGKARDKLQALVRYSNQEDDTE